MAGPSMHLARAAEAAFERRGDYESLLFEGRWHRSSELFHRAAAVASGLTQLGLEPGERVVVTMTNCAEVGVIYQAVWRAGLVATPAMFLLAQDDLRHLLADSGARAVVTTPEFLDKVRRAVTGLDPEPRVICTGTETDGAVSLAELEAAPARPIVPRADGDLAALLYTGGTTGRYTGDVGRLDEDGYLYIVDRIKDLIIRGGFNVYPRDVEDALVEHPAVAMAGVVGAPSASHGEEVVAFVSLRAGAALEVEQLIDWSRERIGGYKYPRRINVIDAIPLTPVGKVDRKALRALLTSS
jgi:acyl-CoA synthetase (AMP-forming)/AMP-acid ligase II